MMVIMSIGIGDYYEEAKEIADKYDKKMVKKLQLYCDDMGDKKGYEWLHLIKNIKNQWAASNSGLLVLVF
mgnify:CR=1 FL=1